MYCVKFIDYFFVSFVHGVSRFVIFSLVGRRIEIKIFKKGVRRVFKKDFIKISFYPKYGSAALYSYCLTFFAVLLADDFIYRGGSGNGVEER